MTNNNLGKLLNAVALAWTDSYVDLAWDDFKQSGLGLLETVSFFLNTVSMYVEEVDLESVLKDTKENSEDYINILTAFLKSGLNRDEKLDVYHSTEKFFSNFEETVLRKLRDDSDNQE